MQPMRRLHKIGVLRPDVACWRAAALMFRSAEFFGDFASRRCVRTTSRMGCLPCVDARGVRRQRLAVAALFVGVDEQGTWSNKRNVWSARCEGILSDRS